VVLCLKFNGNKTGHDRYWQNISFYFLKNVRKCTAPFLGHLQSNPQSTNFKSANNYAVFDPILIFCKIKFWGSHDVTLSFLRNANFEYPTSIISRIPVFFHFTAQKIPVAIRLAHQGSIFKKSKSSISFYLREPTLEQTFLSNIHILFRDPFFLPRR
jgi:hypothetical protein